MSAKKQTFEMKSPKERHLADREWVGGATPFLNKLLKKSNTDG
jgi:hypothetical protein